MYAWQLYTGIGFLFHSQTLAFFLNSFSAVTAFFVTYLGLSSLKKEHTRYFFNIPLLFSTVFIALPMVVFQTAKDMKLDIGLYTISFLAMILLAYIFQKEEGKHFSKKGYSIIFIIGLLAGLAFTIKVTSLLLISAIIGVFAYVFLGYRGFLAYIFFYIALFSFGRLWGLMNVVFPKESILVNSISAIS